MTKREIMVEALSFRYPEFKSFSDAFKLNVADQILRMDENMDIDRVYNMFEYEFIAERATMNLLAMPEYYTVSQFQSAGSDIYPNANDDYYVESIENINYSRKVTEDIYYKLEDYNDVIDDDDRDKILAFILHKELTLGDLYISLITIDNNRIEYMGEEWLVLDDNEAENEAREYAENYASERLDDLFRDCRNDNLRYYFDTDKYATDVLRDGRGALLSSYDGVEHESFVNKCWYFLYRTN